MSNDEQIILKIVYDEPELYTTEIAWRFDEDDAKNGHQNRTRRILKSLEEQGFVQSEKRGRTRHWRCTKKGEDLI